MGTLNSRCRIIIGTQKGTIFLTTTHMDLRASRLCSGSKRLGAEESGSVFKVQGLRASGGVVNTGLGFRVWGLGFRV